MTGKKQTKQDKNIENMSSEVDTKYIYEEGCVIKMEYVTPTK